MSVAKRYLEMLFENNATGEHRSMVERNERCGSKRSPEIRYGPGTVFNVRSLSS